VTLGVPGLGQELALAHPSRQAAYLLLVLVMAPRGDNEVEGRDLLARPAPSQEDMHLRRSRQAAEQGTGH